jgi:hypothetical protein
MMLRPPELSRSGGQVHGRRDDQQTSLSLQIARRAYLEQPMPVTEICDQLLEQETVCVWKSQPLPVLTVYEAEPYE